MLKTGADLFQAQQWRLWLFQLLLWALLLPAYTSWSLALFALLLIAKLWQLYRRSEPWSLGYSNLLAGGMLVALLLNARELGVMHLMFHFLLLAAILRLLGLAQSRRRDIVQLLWVHYFLLACAFILHQNLWLAATVFIAFGLNLHAHYLCFCTQKPVVRWRRVGQTSIILLLLTVAMFVLFPRLPPLWQLPGAQLTQTGLADELAPGSVSELLQSDDLAFRVRFDNDAPPASQRYFRAKIYDVFDGTTWRAQRAQPSGQFASSEPAPYRYTIVAEPHRQFSLFTLGVPQEHSKNTVLNNQALLITEQPLSQRISYQVGSNLGAIPARGNINRYLQLPAGNPRSRVLALQLQQNAGNAAALVQQIGAYFRQQAFEYTLSPGEITNPQIDNFLFERKRGFCSHYAGSTVFLLRAAGIPARLVGGYLGGDWQDDGAYLQVLQKNAHAWVEYYQEGEWHRFDPTALIQPSLLLELPTDTAFTDFADSRQDWMRQRLEAWLMQPLRNMDYYWSMWVLSFDNEQQQGLFDYLKSWHKNWRFDVSMLLWLLLPALLFAGFWWYRRPPVDKTRQLFQPLLAIKAKSSAQTYQQYLQQWLVDHPHLATDIDLLTAEYLRWQFGNEPQGYIEARRALRQLVTKIKRPGS
jgi:transglutaminase-like putative cysteine protease